MVQFDGPASSNGVPDDISTFTAYVVIESNTSDLGLPVNEYDVSRFRVAVSRV